MTTRLPRLINTFYLLIIALFITNQLGAQNLKYVKNLVDTLSSEEYHGRGYVKGGGDKAANFIANEFKKLGLSTFKDHSYFQNFSHSVNTFPGIMHFSAQGKVLQAGVDYLVKPWSKGCKRQKLQVFYLEKKHVTSLKKFEKTCRKIDKAHTALIIPFETFHFIADPAIGEALRKNTMKMAAFIYTVESKLMWSVAQNADNFVAIEVLASSLPNDMEFIELEIEQKFIPKYQNRNVIGFLEGNSFTDSFIVISAHYDHLGRMGNDACFYGTNDNASGTAMLIDLAREMVEQKEKNGGIPYNLVFIAFAAEEAGLIGSKYFTEYPWFPLRHISMLLNLDLVSTGADGIMVVNGSVYKQIFNQLNTLNDKSQYVKTIKKRGKASNSDHYWFSENGVPSIFIYLLGEYPHYHDVFDSPDKPNWAGYNGFYQLLKELILTRAN